MKVLNLIFGYILIYPVILILWLLLKKSRSQLEQLLSNINLVVIILGLFRILEQLFRMTGMIDSGLQQNAILEQSNYGTILNYVILGMEIIIFLFLLPKNRRKNFGLSMILVIILLIELAKPILEGVIFGNFPDFIPLVLPFEGAIIIAMLGIMLFLFNRMKNKEKLH